MEEGREFWGRYPLEFQAGISAKAYLSPLHEKMLKQHYFPVVGSVPKHFVGRNRRHLDLNVTRFEDDSDKTVEREAWGLPRPNLEASYISLAKYAKDVKPLSPLIVAGLNTAFAWTERQFAPVMMNSRVKTLEEVVCGLDKTTSPGWPWVQKYKTKKDMIESWSDFSKYMEEDWERLKYPGWTAVFGNSLKEEIRPTVKIEQNSIRTFTAGPVEATIHGNRLFEDMNQKFYEAHLRIASVVGFSPLKGGWDNLYKKLAKFPMGFALDESQYDSSLRAYLMWNCAEFRWRMLRPEDQTDDNKVRLQTYYRNLINTLIITSEGVFVMKLGGNPSGSVNTITDNTIILYTLLAYAWIVNAPEEMRSYEAFEEHTSKALVGDDNTFTVSPEAMPFFNAKNIIPTWEVIGITTTTDCMDPRPVEELDFLSAHTTFVDGVAVPLYDRSKLLTSLLYSRFPSDPAYTLVRATALQRVAWADAPMRAYLQEFVAWLLSEYDHVLFEEETWKQAKNQIPVDYELKKLFLGEDRVPLFNQGLHDCPLCDRWKPKHHRWCKVCLEKKKVVSPARKAVYQLLYPELFQMEKQSLCGARERCNSRIKSFEHRIQTSMIVGQVARPQRMRKRRVLAQKRGSPFKQVGIFAAPAGGFRMPSRNGGKRRRARRGGRGRQTNFTGTVQSGPKGLKLNKQGRWPFPSKEEFIADIYGSTTFGSGAGTTQARQFPLNPGQAGTFPWLNKTAQNFEKYVLTSCVYHVKHEVSEFATAGTTGLMMMGIDYDAADAPPVNESQILNSDDHNEAMPCKDFSLAVDCKVAFANGPKYVRTGNLPGGADIKTYDCGLLNIAASGTADATTKLGKLFVRYSGYFIKPVQESSASAPVNNQVAWFQSTSAESFTNGVAKTLALATTSANGISAVNSTGSIVLPSGNYLVDASMTGASSTPAISQLILDVQKNAASIFVTTMQYLDVAANPDRVPISTQSGFVTSNGTDAFTVVGTVGGTGTLTGWGSVRFVAI